MVGHPGEELGVGQRDLILILSQLLSSAVWGQSLNLHSLENICRVHGIGVTSTDPGAYQPESASRLCHLLAGQVTEPVRASVSSPNAVRRTNTCYL